MGLIYNSTTNSLLHGNSDKHTVYLSLLLRNRTDDEIRTFKIRRLLASVFIKRQIINQFTNGLSIYNKDLEAHYRDGNRSNNFFENIKYVTRAQNLICAQGKAVVALAENKNAIPITYWSMKSCYSTYGINCSTFIFKYLNKNASFSHMGQLIKFITMDSYNSKNFADKELIECLDKKFKQFRHVVRDLSVEKDDKKNKLFKNIF
jgi:hypothetical protein